MIGGARRKTGATGKGDGTVRRRRWPGVMAKVMWKACFVGVAGMFLLATGATGATTAPTMAPAPNPTGSFMEFPVPLWTAAVAAAFSLLMVVVTNLFNDRRLRKQFEYERSIRNEDRSAQMRREIYLAAAEAIHAGIVAIMSLGNIDKTVEDATREFTAKSPAISKAQLIAGAAVLRSVTDVNTEIGIATIKMASWRIPVDGMRSLSEQNGRYQEGVSNDIDKVMARLQGFDAVKHGGEVGLNLLRENLKLAEDYIAKLRAESESLTGQLLASRLELMDKAIVERGRVMEFVLPAMTALGTELGFPTDGDLLEDVLGESERKQREAADKLLADVRKMAAGDGAEVEGEGEGEVDVTGGGEDRA